MSTGGAKQWTQSTFINANHQFLAVISSGIILIFQKVGWTDLKERIRSFGSPVVVDYAFLLLSSGLRSDISSS